MPDDSIWAEEVLRPATALFGGTPYLSFGLMPNQLLHTGGFLLYSDTWSEVALLTSTEDEVLLAMFSNVTTRCAVVMSALHRHLL